MLRKPSATLVAACCLLTGNASANYTIDLIWADTGTATLTAGPGDPGVGATGAPCSSGFLYDGSATGRCLIVRLTAAAPVTAALVTLGWNAAASGLAVDHVGLRSFGQFGGSGFPGATPGHPVNTETDDCLSLGCDTAFGSFAAVSSGPIAAGVYTLGSINFDTSGFLGGSVEILNFLRTGVDVVTDQNLNPAPVQLNGAILDSLTPPIPEPGTGSLLGLGVLGLCAIARRRR
jgi:hypothetical protein